MRSDGAPGMNADGCREILGLEVTSAGDTAGKRGAEAGVCGGRRKTVPATTAPATATAVCT